MNDVYIIGAGEPAYFKHTIGASKKLMERVGTTPKETRYANVRISITSERR